jgi:Ca2+-binding RTX toxin-like protein
MSPRPLAHAAQRGALVAAVVLAALVPLADQAVAENAHEASIPTCNGETATIVGSPGATLLGTAGSDVIVTKGAARVDSGAGNDSICVTGKGEAVINAGPGDDFVGARSHRGRTFVSLGFGDDTFLGGRGADRVWSQEASNQTSTTDSDNIQTGAGDDYVISGSSAAPNSDFVLLGPGNDALVTYGFSTSANLSGGIGVNTLQPLPGPDASGDWTFDNTTGQGLLDESVRLTWTTFQRFDLTGLQGPRVRFLGSKANEWVLAGGTCRVVLRGRAGDDRLTVDDDGCNNLPAGNAVLSGGPGNDQLFGSVGDDVLRGGGGVDHADGGLGSDRCVAEFTTSC